MTNLLKLRRTLVSGYFTADFRMFTKSREEIDEKLKFECSIFHHVRFAVAELNVGTPEYPIPMYCLESYSVDLKKHQNITSKLGEKRTAFTPERAIEICRAENAREFEGMYPKDYGIVRINEDLAFVEIYKNGYHVDGL